MSNTIDPAADAWLQRSRSKLGAMPLGPRSEQVGRVEEVGDGIALLSGLPGVRLDELLQFERGQYGFVQSLTRNRVGCVLFDQADASLKQLIERRKIDKPVLVGHSLGGTLALRFAGEHPQMISGVVAVDGLPVFPGMERMGVEQRKAMAARIQQQMAALSPEQFAAQSLGYMQKIGVIDPQLAARYAPMNARSDIKASAQYMAEDMVADYRPGLKNANVPILEISPYNAPDFSQPPMAMSEAQKTAYYESLLAGAPRANVVSISPSRHFVMLDQPQKFQRALDGFLTSL